MRFFVTRLVAALLSILFLTCYVATEEIDCQQTLHCTNVGGCGSDVLTFTGCIIQCGLKVKDGIAFFEVHCGDKMI
jgi:hypothetical protein